MNNVNQEKMENHNSEKPTPFEVAVGTAGVLLFLYLSYRGINWLLKPASTVASPSKASTSITNASVPVTDIVNLLQH